MSTEDSYTTQENAAQPGDVIIPNDPAIHKAIKDAFEEIANSKVRAKGEKTFQNESFKLLAEKTQIPKSFLKALASWNQREGGRDAAISQVESLDVAYSQVYGQDAV